MKKIPNLFDNTDSSAKKRARSPQKRMNSPQKRLNSPRSVFSPLEQEITNIRVYARFRPLNQRELDMTRNGVGAECCQFPDSYTVCLHPDKSVHTFDRTFNISDSQATVYSAMQDSIKDVLDGYNGTIFAYGQTGSGKTYSMFGQLRDQLHKGVIPRSMQNFRQISESIFQYINQSDPDCEFVLTCSMLEIYKETLYDLLSVNRTDLKIKENNLRGIYVENLTQISLQSEAELLRIVELGEQTRKVAATRINQYSSRSHTIFMLEIKQKLPNETEKKGKLNLVDLAGSEKVGKTGAMGDILEEAKKINLSLSCLGNVIHALTTSNEHIPYRNSKLTRILQESLGGNFKTSLIVTCSSHSSSLEETISTLKFASRAKSIKNHYKMNVKMSSEMMQQLIRELKEQLQQSQSEVDLLKKRSIHLDSSIPSENTQIISYDSKQLSNFKGKHQSYQSTPNISEIQKTVDLSFFSSKKTSQPEVSNTKDNEINLLKTIEDLRSSLQLQKVDNQKKQAKIQQLTAKVYSLENIVQKQQKMLGDPKSTVNPLQVEFNQILLDENTFLNQQLSLLQSDQEDYFNNLLKDKMEMMNIEYFRKMDLLINGEVHQGKVTKVINKSMSLDQVVQKLSIQNHLSAIHRQITYALKPFGDVKKILEVIEEQLKSPQVEDSLQEVIQQYELMKSSRSEEQKSQGLRIEISRLNQVVACQNEQIQQLSQKNEKITELLKTQNQNLKQKLSIIQNIQVQLSSQLPLSEHDSNKRPISSQGDRIQKIAKKPSNLFQEA